VKWYTTNRLLRQLSKFTFINRTGIFRHFWDIQYWWQFKNTDILKTILTQAGTKECLGWDPKDILTLSQAVKMSVMSQPDIQHQVNILKKIWWLQWSTCYFWMLPKQCEITHPSIRLKQEKEQYYLLDCQLLQRKEQENVKEHSHQHCSVCYQSTMGNTVEQMKDDSSYGG
jgi:hypothetical protein